LQYVSNLYFKENFNKALLQCSHSRHANIIQTWGHNCNKTKLVCIDVNIISIKLFKMSKKWKTWTWCHCLCQRNLNKICVLFSNLKRFRFKPIFISHHVMCSLISFYCLNHLGSILMNLVDSDTIGVAWHGYKLVFHN
jgi:hypothetical protein